MATILVVDDSSVDRRFVGGLLARDGRFQVEFAEDGSQALARMAELVVDRAPLSGGRQGVSAKRDHGGRGVRRRHGAAEAS